MTSFNESTDTEMLFESIKDCFVTGKWSADEDAEKLLADDGKKFTFLFPVNLIFRDARAI